MTPFVEIRFVRLWTSLCSVFLENIFIVNSFLKRYLSKADMHQRLVPDVLKSFYRNLILVKASTPRSLKHSADTWEVCFCWKIFQNRQLETHPTNLPTSPERILTFVARKRPRETFRFPFDEMLAHHEYPTPFWQVTLTIGLILLKLVGES